MSKHHVLHYNLDNYLHNVVTAIFRLLFEGFFCQITETHLIFAPVPGAQSVFEQKMCFFSKETCEIRPL